VEFREFRATLVYLRSYLELFQMFDEVDQDDDKMVDLEEFKARALEKAARRDRPALNRGRERERGRPRCRSS